MIEACCAPEGDREPSGFADQNHQPYQNQHQNQAQGQKQSAPHWPFGFRPERTSDGFFERIEAQTPKQQIDERHRIDLVYGSRGKADEVYFTWRQDQLFELPFAWLHPWDC